jgi:hypothetical protein
MALKKKEGELEDGQEKAQDGIENLIDDDPVPVVNNQAEKKNKEVKRMIKGGSKSEDSSILTKISVEMAGFNRLKGFILSKKETSNIRLMRVLSILYGIITIAFLIYDSFQNKDNLSDMGEYLKENLYFNHSKIAVAILYFSGLNLKWYKDGHINLTSCPNRDCREFYTNIMIEAINDVKTQKENFTKFYEDFRDILKREQQMDLDLYNLDYTDRITIDTDNLLNLLVFNGLKLKAGLDTYFDGSINGVFDIASSNLLKQSLNYFYSDISSFRDKEKEKKIKENFTLVPIALICSAVLFAALIIGFIYIVYKIYSNEIYFLEKLINFNSPNFDGYLKSLEDIKKRLRLESDDDEDKDDDMEMESKKATKKEEEVEEKSKKKKKANEEKTEENQKKGRKKIKNLISLCK